MYETAKNLEFTLKVRQRLSYGVCFIRTACWKAVRVLCGKPVLIIFCLRETCKGIRQWFCISYSNM